MRSKVASILLLVAMSPSCPLAAPADSLLGPAPGSYRYLSPDSVIKIPFEVFRGDIRMVGHVNGREVRMLIDNGFLWDQLLFFGGPQVDSLGLEYEGEAQVGGSGEGEAVPSQTASGITISFPGVEFRDQTAIITPYNWELAGMWSGTHGQVSATFFKHFVVEVDFDEMVLTLTDPARFTYRGNGVEVAMESLLPGSFGIPAVVEFDDGRRESLVLAMDLGLGDALEFFPGMEHDIAAPGQSIEASLGFGVQGETLGRYGRVRSVEIGGYKIESVVAGFVSPDYTGRVFHEANVGLELMSRFNITFDYPHGRLFLEPNHTFAEPFEYDMSGMSLRRGKGGYLKVVRVAPDSPASEAGLAVGDKVVSIDGRPAAEYDYWSLRPMLRREGDTLTLVLLKEGREEVVRLKLRRLI